MSDTPKGHLLVVDDNELNRDMLSRRLQRKGYTVEVAVEASRLAAGVYVVVVEGETVRASTRLSVVR